MYDTTENSVEIHSNEKKGVYCNRIKEVDEDLGEYYICKVYDDRGFRFQTPLANENLRNELIHLQNVFGKDLVFKEGFDDINDLIDDINSKTIDKQKQ